MARTHEPHSDKRTQTRQHWLQQTQRNHHTTHHNTPSHRVASHPRSLLPSTHTLPSARTCPHTTTPHTIHTPDPHGGRRHARRRWRAGALRSAPSQRALPQMCAKVCGILRRRTLRLSFSRFLLVCVFIAVILFERATRAR